VRVKKLFVGNKVPSLALTKNKNQYICYNQPKNKFKKLKKEQF
jgi:hypothetical protein